MTKNDILSIENLKKSFRSTEILHGLSFELKRGEILGIIGPNGAGKTTLLKILSGFLGVDAGNIYLDGKDLTRQSKQLNQHVSTIFGGGRGFYGSASVIENLRFFATLQNVPRKERQSRIAQALEQTKLTEETSKKVHMLSMGLTQRLHIARGLLSDAPIMLLDEPTNGLDVESAHDIRALVKKIALDGRSIIITSHILQEIADLSDRVLLINKGQFAFKGTIPELVSQSRVQRIDRDATLDESYLAFVSDLNNQEGL